MEEKIGRRMKRLHFSTLPQRFFSTTPSKRSSNFYIPSFTKEEDMRNIHEIIQQYPLATLLVYPHANPSSLEPISPILSYLPFILDQEKNVLKGHIARANPLAKLYRGKKEEGETNTGREEDFSCLVMFHGPDAYISPTWYESKKESGGKTVPTWNYIVIHINGKLTFKPEHDWMHQLVSELSDHHEKLIDSEWKITDAPSSYIETNLKAILGVEIKIENIRGKFKLSQNRSLPDRYRVIENLRKSSRESDRQIAHWMEKAIQTTEKQK